MLASWLMPSPRGGGRAAVQLLDYSPRWRVRFLPPGAPLDAPGAREITANGSCVWALDGRSWVYNAGRGRVHRFWVETGDDLAISDVAQTDEFALSSDGQTLYFTEEVGITRRQVITNFADRH